MNLETFNNDWYEKGSLFKRVLWYTVNSIVFNSYLIPSSSVKCFLLKIFGAKVGKKVVVKPKINIKYPWNITIGNNVWIGEEVWIDSLGKVTIGNNVCISQGAYLLTGNHNYSKKSFDLMVEDISIDDGVWIGAKSIICPGITCQEYSVLSVGSVATKDLNSFSIYQGNPAILIRKRTFKSES